MNVTLSFTVPVADATRILALLSGTSAVVHSGAAPAVAAIIPATLPAPGAEPAEAVNANAPAFDTTGLPWDERIHSASKAQNGDGTWRKRRGQDEAIIRAVEAELRQRSPAPAVATAPAPVVTAPAPAAPAPVVTAPAPAPVATDPFAAVSAPTAAVPIPPAVDPFAAVTAPAPVATAPVVTAPAPAPASQPGWSFALFMKAVGAAMQTGGITPADMKAMTDSVGVANPAVLANDPVKFNEALNYFIIMGKLPPVPPTA